MSFCYDDSNMFNALRAVSSHGSGRLSEHRRSNSILFLRPRKMSNMNELRRITPTFFNGAAGPASGSNSSIQTFGTP